MKSIFASTSFFSKNVTFPNELKTIRCKWYYILIIIMSLVSSSFSGAFIVSWNANTEPDLAGYKVYFGSQPSNYSFSQYIGKSTYWTLTEEHVGHPLVGGEVYYMAVTALDSAGNESSPSEEVSAVVTGPKVCMNVQDDGVRLLWSPTDGADSYDVYQDTIANFTPNTPIATVSDINGFMDNSFVKKSNKGSYYQVKALSEGSEVYTYDKVGVYSVSVKPGKNLLSLPFVPIDSTLCGVLSDQLTGATDGSAAAKVEVWNGHGTDVAWKVNAPGFELHNKWVTESGAEESPLQIKPDQAFWITIRDDHPDSLLTFIGKISPDSSREISLIKGYNFVGSCYPVEVSLDSTELREDGVVQGSNNAGDADKVMIWNGSGFDYAWLVDGTGTQYDGKWFNPAGTAESTLKLKPGQGYVIHIKNNNVNTEWTFPRPRL